MFKTFVNTFPQVSPDTYQKIVDYYELLKKWNKSHNLVQRKTLEPDEFEIRHLIDSWQLFSFLDRQKTVLDIGSGAGMPGILLAIAGFDVHLIEIDKNKSSFLKNCKATLDLSCMIHTVDAYSLQTFYPQITARGFSALKDLLSIQSTVSRETIGVYLKGIKHQSEIEQAQSQWNFEFECHPSISSETGQILTVTNVSTKN